MGEITQTERLVVATQRRLATIQARKGLHRWGAWPLMAACVVALARPLIWPLSDTDPLWAGAPRAALLWILVTAFGWTGLYFWRRRRPGIVTASRAVDETLGLREVVSSAMALDGSSAEEQLARARGLDAVRDRDVRQLFPLPRLRPRWRRLGLGLLTFALVSLLGAWDPGLAAVLLAPPTAAELNGADELERAAAELQRLESTNPGDADVGEPESERRAEASREGTSREGNEPRLAERAESISRELARGDREGALQKLRALRDAVSDRQQRSRDLDRAARALARHLDAERRSPQSENQTGDPSTPSGNSRRPGSETQSRGADDSMRLLARRLREQEQNGTAPDPRERERTLERLSRAADEARRSGSQQGERLAEALSEAAEALNRGARDEAARRLEEAAARAGQLQAERQRRAEQARALARLLESAGMLERDVQLAMMGREGRQGEGQMAGDPQGEGQGEGQGDGEGRRGLAAELAARLAAMGLAESPHGRAARHGPGGRGPNRPGTPGEGLETNGDLHASSRVREGERAVQVLEGLGRNGEADTEYSDVYPSYGAIAEDALASEEVPAARREAVRRYFELIRPGHAEGDE